MPTDAKNLDIRWHLGRLLAHEESLGVFVDWFMGTLWDIELHGSDDDVDLAALVENRLGGFSSGYISQDELLADLRADATEFGILGAGAALATNR